MALQRLGKEDEALQTLAQAVGSFDWRASNSNHKDAWLYHVLRRDAKGLILANLSSFLEGKYQPRNNDERVTLLGVCQFNRLTVRAAQIYAGVFDEAPAIAGDLHAGHRYYAACCAALAGCGQGKDASKLSETDQARWREQAREWLRADLVALSIAVKDGEPDTLAFVERVLERWRADPDLAGLRDGQLLEELPESEQQACLAIWGEADALADNVRDADK